MFDLNTNLLFSVHSGGDNGGILMPLESLLAGLEHLLQLPAVELLPALLPGIAALENIHPLFVHFPIAFLTAFFLIDLSASLLNKSQWRLVAGWFLYLGAVFSGFTVVAGLIAAETVAHSEEVHEIMETHEHLGICIFLLAAGLSVWRWFAKNLQPGATNILFLLAAAVLNLMLLFTADLGGLMVYHYGVSVAAAGSAPTEKMAEHQHSH